MNIEDTQVSDLVNEIKANRMISLRATQPKGRIKIPKLDFSSMKQFDILRDKYIRKIPCEK